MLRGQPNSAIIFEWPSTSVNYRARSAVTCCEETGAAHTIKIFGAYTALKSPQTLFMTTTMTMKLGARSTELSEENELLIQRRPGLQPVCCQQYSSYSAPETRRKSHSQSTRGASGKEVPKVNRGLVI